MFPSGGLRVASLAGASDTEFDVAIASWWQDTLLLPRLNASRHAVLNQGMEDRLYRLTTRTRTLVQAAYRVPLPGITISQWVRDRLLHDTTDPLPSYPTVSTSRYFVPKGATCAPRGGSVRVLVEGPLGSWHKNVVPALRLARSLSDETWLLTSTDVGAISRCSPSLLAPPTDRNGRCLPILRHPA